MNDNSTLEKVAATMEAEVLPDLGAGLSAVHDIDGRPVAIAPGNYAVRDLEEYLNRPSRIRANVRADNADSFCAYVEKHARDEYAMYVQMDAEKATLEVLAVFDDNAFGAPAWRQHVCRYTANTSIEWRRWIDNNRKPMSQADFATFLEDNLHDIASVNGSPSGQDMLKMALGLEINAERRLKSRVNLQNGGMRLEYVVDEDKDTRESMEVFARFGVGIPVFEGSASAYPIEARLKYRERDGKVTFWFELIRHDRVYRAAAMAEINEIEERTEISPIFGRPDVG